MHLVGSVRTVRARLFLSCESRDYENDEVRIDELGIFQSRN